MAFEISQYLTLQNRRDDYRLQFQELAIEICKAAAGAESGDHHGGVDADDFVKLWKESGENYSGITLASRDECDGWKSHLKSLVACLRKRFPEVIEDLMESDAWATDAIIAISVEKDSAVESNVSGLQA
jgi:hypothetical protein